MKYDVEIKEPMKFFVEIEEIDRPELRTAAGLINAGLLHKRYLMAISRQAYSGGESHRIVSDDMDDAFLFTDRGAAEMAAVWVGGRVLERRIVDD